MKIIAIKLYSFSELSGIAKQAVLNKYMHINTEHIDWYESTIEQWKTNLAELGFENADIHFSGFSSQGDGASFDGKINAKRMLELNPEFSQLKELIDEGLLTFEIKRRDMAHMYSHEHTRYVDFNASFNISELEIMAEKMADKINDFRANRCKAIYKDLEEENDSLTSDGSIIETIEANDWTFEENGELRNINEGEIVLIDKV